MRPYQLKISILVLLLSLLVSCKSNGQKKQGTSAQSTPLETFDEIKFGMFIHWGLYAIPAGVWKGKEVRGIGEWIMSREKIPVKEYEQLAKEFNPTAYHPDEWAKLAKDAGMKYMVITSKHHDGFAMFKSEVSDFNMVDASPYGKDPMVGLAKACRAQGLQFGFYYSQDQDWHEPNARGNTWDFTDDRDAQVYIQKKAIPQIHEILSNYGDLALIWFDTPGLLTKTQVLELRKTVKTLQPRCLINSRIGHGQHDYFQTGDNAIPIQVYTKEKWEVPATLNDTWGYKTNDHNWKDPKDLVCKLSDIVSKGGNYLLNVGPNAKGEIPEKSQEILRSVGNWLKTNGEAIYGTDPSPFYFPDITWRCTQKEGKLYLHILNWPGTHFEFKGLESKIKQAYFLANHDPVPFKQKNGTVHFTLPKEPMDAYCSVLVLDIEDDMPMVSNGFERDAPQNQIDLYAWAARLRGEELKYDWETKSVSNFVHADFYPNELWWYLYGFVRPGTYNVDVTYAGEADAAIETINIESTLEGWKVDQHIELDAENTQGKFVTTRLNDMLTIGAGHKELRLSVQHPQHDSSVRIRKIRLSKVRE